MDDFSGEIMGIYYELVDGHCVVFSLQGNVIRERVRFPVAAESQVSVHLRRRLAGDRLFVQRARAADGFDGLVVADAESLRRKRPLRAVLPLDGLFVQRARAADGIDGLVVAEAGADAAASLFEQRAHAADGFDGLVVAAARAPGAAEWLLGQVQVRHGQIDGFQSDQF